MLMSYICTCVWWGVYVCACTYVPQRVYVHAHVPEECECLCGEARTDHWWNEMLGWQLGSLRQHPRQLVLGVALTISGLQAIGEAQGQVAFRQELSCFLSKANHHHGKVFCLFQLQRGEVVVTGVGFVALSREGNTVSNLGHYQLQVLEL